MTHDFFRSCLKFNIAFILFKFSEDRKAIEESVLKDYFDFQKHAFEELESLQKSTFDLLTLQECTSQNAECQDLLGTLATVESDYLMIKNQFHALPYIQNVNAQQVPMHIIIE